MRKAMFVGMMALAGMKVHAAPENSQAACQVSVHVEDPQIANGLGLWRAEAIATRMFAGIGVRVCWKFGGPRPTRGAGKTGIPHHPGLGIVLRFVSDKGENNHRGALAYAFPYSKSGELVTVFYDRVVREAMGNKDAATVLLAHVLAHEITHVLQGIDRHSEEGVMKARWTPQDLAQMMRATLPFTDCDVQLIQSAVAADTGIVEIAAQ